MGIEKYNVKFMAGIDSMGPVDGRCYTLAHSDVSGDLFLPVGLEFDRKAISAFYTRLIRDEVLTVSKAEGGIIRFMFIAMLVDES